MSAASATATAVRTEQDDPTTTASAPGVALNIEIGRLLRRDARAAGLDLGEMAGAHGITAGRLSRLESGAEYWLLTDIVALVHAVGRRQVVETLEQAEELVAGVVDLGAVLEGGSGGLTSFLDHHPWCDLCECQHADTEADDGGYASHFGVAANLAIDTHDCLPWRNSPEGAAELRVRPIDFMGHRGVEVDAGDIRCTRSTSGSVGLSWLTPAETRRLATLLLHAADLADS